jgi:chitinase
MMPNAFARSRQRRDNRVFGFSTVCVLLMLAGLAAPCAADWPARVFAPYVYLGAGDNFQITQCKTACGQKFYTVAFIIADKHNDPAWDGRSTMENGLYAGQIDAIRRDGGDVIASFGGAGGTELAIAEPDLLALEKKYQSVIDRYKFTWLDFDIEGRALSNMSANRRRNSAIASLQAKFPGLIVSYTLPVDPNGISSSAQKLLADARAKGVKVHSANLMTMDFGSRFSKGKRMAEVSIVSVLKAREQCEKIDPSVRIGITPMIGQNDKPGEVFTQDDARAVKDWAEARSWVCSLSFWASNRDTPGHGGRGNGNTGSGIKQAPWDFTLIFKSFTTPHIK